MLGALCLASRYIAPMRLEQKEHKKSPDKIGTSFCLIASVAGPGVAPGLEDYEPSVQLYTTPHILKELLYFTSHGQTRPAEM